MVASKRTRVVPSKMRNTRENRIPLRGSSRLVSRTAAAEGSCVESFQRVGLAVEDGVGGAGPLSVVVPALRGGPELVATDVEPLAVGRKAVGPRQPTGQLRVDPEKLFVAEGELNGSPADLWKHFEFDEPIGQANRVPAAVG